MRGGLSRQLCTITDEARDAVHGVNRKTASSKQTDEKENIELFMDSKIYAHTFQQFVSVQPRKTEINTEIRRSYNNGAVCCFYFLRTEEVHTIWS